MNEQAKELLDFITKWEHELSSNEYLFLISAAKWASDHGGLTTFHKEIFEQIQERLA
jgi:hypothetical protein